MAPNYSNKSKPSNPARIRATEDGLIPTFKN
jgi:hypothetical protein